MSLSSGECNFTRGTGGGGRRGGGGCRGSELMDQGDGLDERGRQGRGDGIGIHTLEMENVAM